MNLSSHTVLSPAALLGLVSAIALILLMLGIGVCISWLYFRLSRRSPALAAVYMALLAAATAAASEAPSDVAMRRPSSCSLASTLGGDDGEAPRDPPAPC